MTNSPYRPPTACLVEDTDSLSVSWSTGDAARLRMQCGSYYFAVMAVAGFMVYWPLRDQTTHATPAAIAIACAIASMAAGLVGWIFATAYIRPKSSLMATIGVPALVLASASLVAGLAYFLVTPLFHWDLWRDLLEPHLGAAMVKVVILGLSYTAFCTPVWLLGLPICTYLMRRKGLALMRHHTNDALLSAPSFRIATIPGETPWRNT